MLKLFEPLFRFEATVDEDRDNGRKYFTVTRLKHTDNSKTEVKKLFCFAQYIFTPFWAHIRSRYVKTSIEAQTPSSRCGRWKRLWFRHSYSGRQIERRLRSITFNFSRRCLLGFFTRKSWSKKTFFFWQLFFKNEQLDRCVRLLKDHCSSDTEFSTSTMFRPVEWVNDQAVTHCFRCDTQFSMTFRRHHW